MAVQMEKNIPYWVALLLVIVGGLNWGLVGAFNFNLVAALFGPMSTLTRAVYVLVGLSAIYIAAFAAMEISKRR
jgi:hypothetical protein